eukprot:3941615-Rhodomonas_salina.2
MPRSRYLALTLLLPSTYLNTYLNTYLAPACNLPKILNPEQSFQVFHFTVLNAGSFMRCQSFLSMHIARLISQTERGSFHELNLFRFTD